MTVPKAWRFGGPPAAVHQFHPVLGPGDAMSSHVFALRDRLREWGYESHAYAVEAKPGVDDVISYRRLFRAVRPNDMLILHFSIGHEVFDQLARIDARRVLVYHNVTPPEFFTGINDHAAVHARLGQRQVARLAGAFDLAIGVSEFDSRDLREVGFANVATVPILVDWSAYETLVLEVRASSPSFAGSFGGTRSPVFLSWITSRHPSTAVETMALPAAMASKSTRGVPS